MLSDQEHRVRTVFAKAEHFSRSLEYGEGKVVNETNMWEKEYKAKKKIIIRMAIHILKENTHVLNKLQRLSKSRS